MFINFIYKNNTFTFNVKKEVSITYLKNLASKMIQKDKESFDLFYNNKILSENNSSLFQPLNNKKNIPIIISLKKNSIKLPLLTLPNNLNLNLNESEIFSDSYSKEINKNSKKKIVGVKQKKEEYISQNKVFEDVYNSKDEEIISLMKNLGNKILEFDDTLYKKYKTSYNRDNSQLLLYEKNIMNFKDRQIQFLKKLINYFDNAESSFFTKGKINLDEFYLELSNSNKKIDTNINTNINTKRAFEAIVSTKREKNKSNKNLKLTPFIDKKLPNISVTKNSEDNFNIYNTNKVSENSDSSVEIIKAKIDKIFENEKVKNKNDKIKKEIQLTKSAKINNINKLDELKENLTQIEKIEKNNKNKNFMKKKNILNDEENVKNDKIDKNNKNKKNKKNNFKTLDNKINNNILNNNTSFESENRIEMESFDKDKINVLYEISEEKHEEKETLSENSDSKSDEEIKMKRNKKKFSRLKTMNYKIKKQKNENFVSLKERKATLRAKKLGSNVYDFII